MSLFRKSVYFRGKSKIPREPRQIEQICENIRKPLMSPDNFLE